MLVVKLMEVDFGSSWLMPWAELEKRVKQIISKKRSK